MYCVTAAVLGAFASVRRTHLWSRHVLTSAAAVTALLGGLTTAQAGVLITVNKSTQNLTVSVDGSHVYSWPVSTARWGYNTPNGSYRPERLERKWYSRKYDWSPMPYSIFFDGGYAIHGSYEVARLGSPASHGCIRLHPRNAAVLFSLVRKHRGETRIVVTGQRPSRTYVHSKGGPRASVFERMFNEQLSKCPTGRCGIARCGSLG